MLVLAARSNAQPPQTPNSPESAPLSEEEIKSLILFTERFTLQVEAERALREALKREKDLAARELAASQKETELALKEAADEKKRADEFEALYARASKKQGGFGCFFKRLVFKPCRA